MNHIERRDRGLAYISDTEVFEQQKKCRQILQKLNEQDTAIAQIKGRLDQKLKF